jgi:hypothetical protein
MSGKTAKRLRKLLAGVAMPESKLMQNTKTGQVVRGAGRRKVYQTLKQIKNPTVADFASVGLSVRVVP